MDTRLAREGPGDVLSACRGAEDEYASIRQSIIDGRSSQSHIRCRSESFMNNPDEGCAAYTSLKYRGLLEQSPEESIL